MEINDRLNALVSPFFRNVRNAGLLLTAVGGLTIASHFAFFEIWGSPKECLPVAGMDLAAVSQATASGAETGE